jgi:hypothetical protein
LSFGLSPCLCFHFYHMSDEQVSCSWHNEIPLIT